MTRSRFGLAFALAGAALLIGCSSDAPAKPPVPAEVGPSCTYPSAVAGCASCAATSCCAESAACDDDPQCRLFSGCVARCADGDVACFAACRAERPLGYGVNAIALRSCLAERCERACGFTCGGYVAPTEACGACSESQCCAESAACLADPECAALFACERACYPLDPTCLGRCERAHPAAVGPLRAFGSCLDTSCATTCLPPRFRCLDRPPTPPPAVTADRLTITIRTIRFIDGTPWPGVAVRACPERDNDCAAPLSGPATTNADGFAALTVPGPTFNGYLELSGGGAVNALDFFPAPRADLSLGLALIDESVFNYLTASIAPPRPDRGHFILTAWDCLGLNTAGVSFEIEPRGEAARAYLSDGLPTSAATETDRTGFGGFINVATGTGIQIRPELAAFDRAYPEVAAFTRPGWLSYVNVRPYE